MIAGLLNTIITVLRPTTTKNEFGELIQAYQTAFSTRARVIHNGGSRSQENGEIVYPYSKTFEVYRHNDIRETDLIQLTGQKYRILAIEDVRHQNKKIIRTELVNE